jgi:hypothetical protein
MTTRNTEIKTITIELALAGVREMFPDLQIIVGVRDCGEQTITRLGHEREYFIQVGLNGEDFNCPTLSDCMAQVRKWKESQS